MATSFFGGSFFGGEFFNSGGVPVVPTPYKGGRNDGRKGRETIFKPTGLVDRKATPTIEQRVEESAQLHQEAQIAARAPLEIPVLRRIESMSAAEVDFEIGVLLRKKIRSEEEEILLMMLMMA
jgi:hypothetical protein